MARSPNKGPQANTKLPEGIAIKRLPPAPAFDPFKYMDDLSTRFAEAAKWKGDKTPEEWTEEWASEVRSDAMTGKKRDKKGVA